MNIVPLKQHRHLIAEIAAHLHAEWGSLGPWSDREAIERRYVISSGDAVFPYTLVALEDDGRLAGTASIKLHELAKHVDKELWMGEVFVRNDLRGRRVGTMLVEAIVKYAFASGAEALYLYTPDQQRLYARLGWRECGEDFANGEAVTVMVREKSAAAGSD